MARIETTAASASTRAWVEDRPAVRWRFVLTAYLRIVSVCHLLWALWEWAALIGIVPPIGGTRPARSCRARAPPSSSPVSIRSPPSACGWARPGAPATWLVATFARIIIHTAYAGIFDWDLPWTLLQIGTIAVYLLLFFLSERADREEGLRRRRRPE